MSHGLAKYHVDVFDRFIVIQSVVPSATTRITKLDSVCFIDIQSMANIQNNLNTDTLT